MEGCQRAKQGGKVLKRSEDGKGEKWGKKMRAGSVERCQRHGKRKREREGLRRQQERRRVWLGEGEKPSREVGRNEGVRRRC